MFHVFRRSLAILVNFNVDPDELYAEATFVRKKLIEAVEATKHSSKKAHADHANCEEGLPLRVYRLRYDVVAKQKLDRAFQRYERLEGKLLLPKYSHRVVQDVFLEKGRFDNAYVRQVMGMLTSCHRNFETVVIQAWSIRERLHRDIVMHRRFLENMGIDVADVDWEEILHWHTNKRTRE